MCSWSHIPLTEVKALFIVGTEISSSKFRYNLFAELLYAYN